MYICPRKIAKCLLCSSNICLPINKSHYVTGKDISCFSNLMCVESTLSSLTCNLKNMCNGFKGIRL